MGLMDSAKNLVKGKEETIKDGIDKAADVVADKVPDEHDAKVEHAAEAAKDAVDKLAE